MADQIILRDQNYRTVGAAVTNDADQDITMLLVDPVTQYLLVQINAGTSSSANAVQIAKRDQNYKPVCLAWDDTNNILQEILTDENGNLLCDVIFI